MRILQTSCCSGFQKARSSKTSNFFPKSLQSAWRIRIWLFLEFGKKEKNKKSISAVIQPTARGGLFVSFVCDFGEWLESLASVETPRIFCIPCFYAGCAKKGACLARKKEKPFYCSG